MLGKNTCLDPIIVGWHFRILLLMSFTLRLKLVVLKPHFERTLKQILETLVETLEVFILS